jgi:hypothetical protein
MDTTLWIIIAVVIVIALVVYRYRREIGLTVNGWGVKATLHAKGNDTQTPKESPSGRNVTIDGEAQRNRIVTGDGAAGKKAAAAGGRNVSIGGKAVGNTIVTGDDNKIG